MELLEAVVELKRGNPRFVCPLIAQQIDKAFGVSIDNDVVRPVLVKHYRPGPNSSRSHSWLRSFDHSAPTSGSHTGQEIRIRTPTQGLFRVLRLRQTIRLISL